MQSQSLEVFAHVGLNLVSHQQSEGTTDQYSSSSALATSADHNRNRKSTPACLNVHVL